MVENQHSINNILSFGAKSVNPKILEKLLVGRKKNVKHLFDAVKSIVEHQDNQFILLVGQRGMGKTHLIRVLFHRIQKFIEDKKISVAYFSEEEYGVANYFDFLIRIMNALKKWNEKDSKYFDEKTELLQITPESNRENLAEIIIEEYIGKKPLLILAENFADILEAIKPKEQAKLRAWLYKAKKVSIIATSQAISKDFDTEERPFYEFFNIIYLKQLVYEDTKEFLKLLAELDKRDDVIEFINNKGKGQIKALHSLVKGNHRLLVTFYQFLKTNTLSNLSENFIKTINDLKPYYETYIRNLPPQQQKVLRFIALNRKPVLGVNISKECFIDQKSLTKQLSELIKKRLVEAIPNPNDKRNKLYDIDEPLLRISIEVGEHKEGITAIFIDFLAIYYNENELSLKKGNFEKLLEQSKTQQEKTQLFYEINAIEKAIELKKTEYAFLDEKDVQSAIENYLANNDDKELYEFLKGERLIENKEIYYSYYLQYLYFKEDYNKAKEQIKRLLKINPDSSIAYVFWGMILNILANQNQDENLYKESIEKFKKLIELNVNFAEAYYLLGKAIYDLAKLKKDESLYKESIEQLKKAIELNPNYTDSYYNLGLAYSDLANLNQDENLYRNSINSLEKVVKLNINSAKTYFILGNVISDLAFLKKDKKLFKKSFEKYEKAIELNIDYPIVYTGLCISILQLGLLTKDKKLFNYFSENVYKAIETEPRNESNYRLLLMGIEYMPKIKDISLTELITIIKKISDNKLSDILNKWILFVLKTYKEISKKQIEFLINIAKKHKKENKELVIVENYLGIYKRHVIKGDKKAIYDLPKEQRLFFEEHILNK